MRAGCRAVCAAAALSGASVLMPTNEWARQTLRSSAVATRAHAKKD
jgi:hypothetical protein